MESPTPLWLTDVKYMESKKAIAAEFSRLNFRRMVRLSFFPSFFSEKKVLNIFNLQKILSQSNERFTILDSGNSFKISSATFSGLINLADILFNETGFRPLVLNPERQFLIEKNWTYFDCFTSFSGKEILKPGFASVPVAKFGLFSEALPETIRLAAEESSELAEKILESIALSKILKMPLQDISHLEFAQAEAFLENAFWKTGFGRFFQLKQSDKTKTTGFRTKGLSEIDFSMLWPTLLTSPFYNLSPDSINCNCCKPKNALEKNILPSTLAVVEMKQDGFFFESCSSSFSRNFHKTMSGKESRLRRMQEFYLKDIPLGPFFRLQQVSLPLADALKLASAKKARILKHELLQWFCLKKEGSVSKAVLHMNRTLSLLDSISDKASSSALKEYGVLSQLKLSTNPDFLLCNALLKTGTRLLCAIPEHLCSSESAFFNERLCFAIESVKSSVLENFADFAGKRESRVVATGKNKAFVKSTRPLSLIRQFSKKQHIPALLRAKIR